MRLEANYMWKSIELSLSHEHFRRWWRIEIVVYLFDLLSQRELSGNFWRISISQYCGSISRFPDFLHSRQLSQLKRLQWTLVYYFEPGNFCERNWHFWSLRIQVFSLLSCNENNRNIICGWPRKSFHYLALRSPYPLSSLIPTCSNWIQNLPASRNHSIPS